MRKIKRDDEVILLAGKDKGRTGKVLKVVDSTKKGLRVFVEGLNIVKKHLRGDPQQNRPGKILDKEASIAISNVAILNPRTQKADRVGFKFLEDGRKVRIFKSDGEVIDV